MIGGHNVPPPSQNRLWNTPVIKGLSLIIIIFVKDENHTIHAILGHSFYRASLTIVSLLNYWKLEPIQPTWFLD